MIIRAAACLLMDALRTQCRARFLPVSTDGGRPRAGSAIESFNPEFSQMSFTFLATWCRDTNGVVSSSSPFVQS
jgi:hypothetical protein